MSSEFEDETIKNSVSFRDILNVKQPTVVGKIVDVLPLVKKSRMQSSTVLIFHCIDVSSNSHSLKKFKVIFFAEAAEKMWSLKLGINDYISVREATVFQDYAYSNSDVFYSKVLIFKSMSTLLKYVSFRKKTNAWSSLIDQFESTNQNCPKLNEEVERPEEIVSSSNGINSPCKKNNAANDPENISSTDWLIAIKKKSASSSSNEPVSSQIQNQVDPVSNSKKNGLPKTSSLSKSIFKKRSSESIMHGFVHCHQYKSNEKELLTNGGMSKLKCVYAKLSNVDENMVVNIVAIVSDTPEAPVTTAAKKYCQILRVVDDTKTDGIKIRIYFDSMEDSPILQKYCIILCHNVKISRLHNEVCGTIKESHQVVSFDKDNLEVYYRQSSEYTLTPEDKKRVEFLKNWMFKNIPDSRPFTPFASIHKKSEIVNLRCQIIDLKAFDKNIIVLRVSDGTTCEVPCHKVPFECNFWNSAVSETRSHRKPSKEIDIIVNMPHDHIFKRFKQVLKVGLNIELFNVKLTLVSDTVNTKPDYSLKALLEGTLDNIVPIRKSDRPSDIDNSSSKDVKNEDENNTNHTVMRIKNKRKLFEHSPRNEVLASEENDFEIVEQNTATLSKKNNSSYKEKEVTKSLDTNSTKFTEDIVFTELLQFIKSEDTDSQSQMQFIPMDVPNTDAHESVSSKTNNEYLHQSFRTVVVSERNAIRNRLSDYVTKNDVKNYLLQWPSNPGNEAFFIQITIMSTIPFINGISSDFDTLALISGYCRLCDSFFPFYLFKWIVSDEDGPVSICPKCKEKDFMTPLKHELLCELLLSDEYGVLMPAIVTGHHAENFFGCTVSQLCSSLEAKVRVRTFIDTHLFQKGKDKRPLIVKVIRIHSRLHQIEKYHILS